MGEADNLEETIAVGRGEVVETEHVVSEGEHQFVNVRHNGHPSHPG